MKKKKAPKKKVSKKKAAAKKVAKKQVTPPADETEPFEWLTAMETANEHLTSEEWLDWLNSLSDEVNLRIEVVQKDIESNEEIGGDEE